MGPHCVFNQFVLFLIQNRRSFSLPLSPRDCLVLCLPFWLFITKGTFTSIVEHRHIHHISTKSTVATLVQPNATSPMSMSSALSISSSITTFLPHLASDHTVTIFKYFPGSSSHRRPRWLWSSCGKWRSHAAVDV